ncbi:MAG TPA: hypothetical protein PLO67_10020 [Saprospiraceae bacterium]|nr:hypothetical protein [Saprospiraceae bacterium]HPI06217.1 hypothetical protein [Saprospiraceae bacterium]
MKSIHHFPAPNIVPGQNLTADTFADIFAWIQSLAADAIFAVRRPLRYGLMTFSDGRKPLMLAKNGSSIELLQCIATTSAGSFIGHFENTHPVLRLDLAKENLDPQEQQYDLLVEVNNAATCTFGPEIHDPCRPSFVGVAYRLRVQPARVQKAPVSDALRIGILKYQAGEWQLQEFIPPCTHLGAHARLQSAQGELTEGFKKLTEFFPEVVQQTDSYQAKAMLELRELTVNLGSSLASHSHRYLQLGEHSDPFDLFDFWAAMALQMSFFLDCLKDSTGFYLLLKQCTMQASGVYYTQDSWNKAIQQMANFKYDQEDILSAVEKTDIFINTIVPVFKALRSQYQPSPGPVISEKQETQTW